MTENFGWDFWKDATVREEKDGWEIWYKDGYVTETGPGSYPGDADCPVWLDDPENPYSYN